MKHIVALVTYLAAPLFTVAQLTGTKTIGGANPDYPTITAAVTALMDQGASGGLTFNIRPGTYTGQYDLGTVPGNYGSITFKSENNNASSVVLEYDASSSSDNFIFRLDGTDRVGLRALTLSPLDNNYARAIVFRNHCMNLSVLDCSFNGSTVPGPADEDQRILLFCDQVLSGGLENPQDIIIDGNRFRNGFDAIYLNFIGTAGARSQGLIITDNTLEDQYNTGITVVHAVGQIGDNLLTTNVGASYTGIRTQYFDSGSQIRRNRVQAYATAGGCTGIEVGNTQNTTGNMISNNMIYCAAPGDVWGLAVYNLWDMKIVHNSVLVAAGDQFQSFAFYYLGSGPDGGDALVRNNIFANNAGGIAYQLDIPSSVVVEDHNCLFTTGSNLSAVGGSYHADIPTHQTVTGLGAGDTDADPVFPIQPDLHLNGCTNDLAGQYFFVAASDIDGDARGNPVCDMGADEFSFSATTDAGTIDILASDLPYTLTAPAGSNYVWSDGSNTQSIQVLTPGVFWCEFTDVNGCSYTITWTVNVDFNNSVGEVRRKDVRLFPVPATDVLYATGLVAGTSFTVMDAQGRTVLTGTAGPLSTLDIHSLRSGMHLLRWSDGTTVRSVCFVKQ